MSLIEKISECDWILIFVIGMWAGSALVWIISAIVSGRERKAKERERREKEAAAKVRIKERQITAEDVANERYAEWYRSGKNMIHRLFPSGSGSYMITLVWDEGPEVEVKINHDFKEVFRGTADSLEAGVALGYSMVAEIYNDRRDEESIVKDAIRRADGDGWKDHLPLANEEKEREKCP